MGTGSKKTSKRKITKNGYTSRSFSLHVDVDGLLDKLAAEQKRPRSQIVSFAIQAYAGVEITNGK